MSVDINYLKTFPVFGRLHLQTLSPESLNNLKKAFQKVEFLEQLSDNGEGLLCARVGIQMPLVPNGFRFQCSRLDLEFDAETVKRVRQWRFDFSSKTYVSEHFHTRPPEIRLIGCIGIRYSNPHVLREVLAEIPTHSIPLEQIEKTDDSWEIPIRDSKLSAFLQRTSQRSDFSCSSPEYVPGPSDPPQLQLHPPVSKIILLANIPKIVQNHPIPELGCLQDHYVQLIQGRVVVRFVEPKTQTPFEIEFKT